MSSGVPAVARDEPVELPTSGAEGDQWDAVLDIAEHAQDWTLIGAMMVKLHAYEAGLAPGRATVDVDGMVEVRGVARATRRMTRTLRGLDWEIDLDAVTDGVNGFRFEKSAPGADHHSKRPMQFDLLAPEGTGERTDLTTEPPLRTVPMPGGTQALRRTELLPVRLGHRQGLVPRPNLLGALVIKSVAALRDTSPGRRPERHNEDLALLYAAVRDVPALRRAATAGDVRHLRAVVPIWSTITDALDAQAAYRALTVTSHRS